MKLLKMAVFTGLLCLQSNGDEMKEARDVSSGYSAREIAKSTSEELSKSAPMRVDEISYIASSNYVDSTVVVNTIIVEDSLIKMAYIDTKKMTKDEKSKFAKNLIDNMRKLQLNALCTTPMMRAAMEKGVSYDYVYRWDNFTYLGKVNIDNKACMNSKL